MMVVTKANCPDRLAWLTPSVNTIQADLARSMRLSTALPCGQEITLAPEDLAVIFEVFRQGSTSGRRGGLGIGLDLVRRLTEMHGGSVDVFSEGLGYGARFKVRLPLATPGAFTTATRVAPARRLDQRAILVVEDSADTRDVLQFVLEAEGARVATAGSGLEGVARAVTFRPEIVLCDIGPFIEASQTAPSNARTP